MSKDFEKFNPSIKHNDSGIEKVLTITDLKNLDKWASDKFIKPEIKEAYACQAQMMNVRNQLMKKLGDDFTVTGGTTVPKMTVPDSSSSGCTFYGHKQVDDPFHPGRIGLFQAQDNVPRRSRSECISSHRLPDGGKRKPT